MRSDRREVIKAWIDAANAFAAGADAAMPCPECGQGVLQSEDIGLPSGKVVERRLYCSVWGCAAGPAGGLGARGVTATWPALGLIFVTSRASTSWSNNCMR